MTESQATLVREPYDRSRLSSFRDSVRRDLVFRRSIYGMLFVAPAMLFFLVFNLYPMVNGFYLSLTDYTLLRSPEFVGLKNYTGLTSDAQFINSLKVTALFVFGTTVPKWIISLGLALLFVRYIFGREVFKALYFMPALLPGVVVALVWKLIFHPNGLATIVARPATGRAELFWMADAQITPWTLILVDNWAGIPFFMVIWIAGLVGIPREFYEAALIDGAGRWQAFWHVTLPLLRPTTVFVVVISTILAFQAFHLQYIMTRGGPSNVTTTIALLVYNYGFNYFRMGVAAAMSVFMFALIIILTLVQLRLARADETSYT